MRWIPFVVFLIIVQWYSFQATQNRYTKQSMVDHLRIDSRAAFWAVLYGKP